MSIFWIGGPEGVIVPMDQINATEEDRYFLPGVIHGGEDYLIQVYEWNNDGTPEGGKVYPEIIIPRIPRTFLCFVLIFPFSETGNGRSRTMAVIARNFLLRRLLPRRPLALLFS